MTKVYGNKNAKLFYCNAEEYEKLKSSGKKFSALLCAKHPFHKEIVGYSNNCPKDNPEYLIAHRPEQNLMALNMVDAKRPEFFSKELVYPGLIFISQELEKGNDVVVVCNKGESRSPTMCLMFMMIDGFFDFSLSFDDVIYEFSLLARDWNPGQGILEYCKNFWNKELKGGN